MPTDFLTLVAVCAGIILLLKLLKASAKLIIGACVLAGIVWFAVNILPTLGVL